TTLTTAASTASYDLPDGAGYIEGPLFFPSESGYPEIRTVDAETVHRHWQESMTGGVPMIAALQPKTSAGTAGQKNEIIFWPVPDAEYVLTYKYRILPDALADAAQYALGGSAHSQTIRAACLAEAEMRDNDTIGMYTADYTRLLEQSIAYDARAYAPRSLGRMGNGRLGRRIRTLRPSLTLEVEESHGRYRQPCCECKQRGLHASRHRSGGGAAGAGRGYHGRLCPGRADVHPP